MYGKRVLLFAVILVIAIALVQTSSLRPRAQNDFRSAQIQQTEIPIVDYGDKTSESLPRKPEIDETRRAKSSRHDKELAVRDLDTGGNSVLSFSHWDAALPALPVARSALVVLGHVLEAKAFLSNDKTGIYSEFTISTERVFKSDGSTPVFHGGLVTAERSGGRVRFSSGRIITYGNRGQGMPSVGQRYVFFLERSPEQYTILTAYELLSGKIRPLDGKNALGGENSDWEGNIYLGVDESRFLVAVENAAAGQ